ncbi:hypothetical protein ACSS6W_004620 [Trichoderma asperelloides]|uniref:Uncharacterized protein n=1 Tax=Trichoderma asperellum TaxID=101201 RepID=A0A6V8QWW9_TRIAP|nr:hypothetical protein LI328DRAFT_109863 [Trichoderma asperelloides]GFP56860.1 hypothetical protein TASIC1_0007035200 [Trichoderma asperellum]
MRFLFVLSLSGLATASAARERFAALPIIPEGLTPRYVFDRSQPLLKRDGICGDNHHSCLDIGHGDACCDNDSYCFLDTSFEPKCCEIGQTCAPNNPCPASAVRCTVTTTLTLTHTSSPTQTRAKETTITSKSTSVITGCCGRSCPRTSQYLCAKTLGGECCPFDTNCEADGNCVFTKTKPPPGLTPAATGSCTTSQFRCSDGNGCCNNGATCTSFSGSAYCSTATGGPTSTLIAPGDGGSSSPGGLSAGAEAGIAVGSVVGGGLIVAAAVWYLFRRRRAAAAANHVYNPADPQPRDVNGDAAAPSGPTMSTAPATPRTWRQRWTMASSLTPSGAVTDAGTIRSPSSAPDPVEIGSEALSEVAGSEVMTPKSEITGFALTGLRTPETIDGRFELGGTEMAWPQPSPASPEPSPQPEEQKRDSKSSSSR